MTAHRVSRTPRQRILLILAGLIVVILTAPPAIHWAWMTFISRPQDKPMLPHSVLRVGIDASYPPFGIDQSGELSGLDVDLARAVAGALGVEIAFVNMGYDGLYDSLRADQVDALFSALRVDPLRNEDALYTTSYFDAGQVLVRPQESTINAMAEMEGLTLAIEFGTEGDLEARRWQRRLSSLEIVPFETAAQALQAVEEQTADAALVDAVSARLWLRDHPDLTIAPDHVTHDSYAGAVQADNFKLLEAINTALAVLEENGTIDAIIQKWL